MPTKSSLIPSPRKQESERGPAGERDLTDSRSKGGPGEFFPQGAGGAFPSSAGSRDRFGRGVLRQLGSEMSAAVIDIEQDAECRHEL